MLDGNVSVFKEEIVSGYEENVQDQQHHTRIEYDLNVTVGSERRCACLLLLKGEAT